MCGKNAAGGAQFLCIVSNQMERATQIVVHLVGTNRDKNFVDQAFHQPNSSLQQCLALNGHGGLIPAKTATVAAGQYQSAYRWRLGHGSGARPGLVVALAARLGDEVHAINDDSMRQALAHVVDR